MKISFFRLSLKNFSKSVSVPPKLKNTTGDPRKNQNLFKYESLIDNKRDNNLEKEKIHYNNLIDNCSKTMIFNHFKLNDFDNNYNFNQFYSFTSKLGTKDINKLIQIINEIKNKLDSDDIQKTEDLFKFLLSKIYNLTEDKGKSFFNYLKYSD